MVRLTGLPSRFVSLPPQVARPPKTADQFYNSTAWRALTERRKLDADYRAAVARGKPGERVYLDHVIEIRDGGALLDPANTQWLTHGEHQAKTGKARKARVHGKI